MDETPCRHCLSPIRKGASVCPACQTHQNPVLAKIGFLSSGVAVAVAVASLLTSVYGLRVVKTQVHAPKSDIRLTAPQLHDGFVTLNAVNVGDAPGSLRPSTIDSPMLGGLLPLTSSSANDEFVPVGAKRVTFRYRQQLSLENEWKAREQAGLTSPDDNKAGTISITVVENDGTEKLVDVDIPIGRFVELENERMGEDPAYGPPPGNSGEL